MNLIYPSVEYWPNNDNILHVAKCARVCYASEKDDAESSIKLYDRLMMKNHTSMFRHESHYYIIKRKDDKEHYKKVYRELEYYRYCDYIDWICEDGVICVTLNGDFYRNQRFRNLINLITDNEVPKSIYEEIENGFLQLRHTFCIITQISTSRELNRTSPNNIAEQSTRYVNFGKKGGITICLPHWWDKASWFKKTIHKVYWKGCELMYNLLLKLGFQPQDARGVLPLDIATKVVYTYSVREWEHILDLRLFNKTGSAHPNCRTVCKEIHNTLLNLNYDFDKTLTTY